MLNQKLIELGLINVYSIIISLVVFAIMITVVFISGSTFGQRCAKVHEYKSIEWSECVNTLASKLPSD